MNGFIRERERGWGFPLLISLHIEPRSAATKLDQAFVLQPQESRLTENDVRNNTRMQKLAGDRLVGETSTEAILIKFRNLPTCNGNFPSESPYSSKYGISARERLKYKRKFITFNTMQDDGAYEQPEVAKPLSFINAEERLRKAY
ncbi:hypothetical protein S7711_10592 [Stachybotrys chartarum IBT 7711]|uniref:Uncharacterized protein n=1 Tax=Stachybotrys chartarum (strain CBS 109288 / IBT 7711) TaxID=1280523 RepID=A0A084B8Y5_STACB|nr:hypothetical protein S7711_10592 [Stachybotrys chartarum IBT 7711]KFA81307.1 hypothetical protein S40288_10967 [Stachybotrys chartarum IBT 40288]